MKREKPRQIFLARLLLFLTATLTTTSVEDGGGGWVVGGVGRAEDVAEAVGGLPVEAELDVGIAVGGDAAVDAIAVSRWARVVGAAVCPVCSQLCRRGATCESGAS